MGLADKADPPAAVYLSDLIVADNGLGDGDVGLLMGRDWPCLEILGLRRVLDI